MKAVEKRKQSGAALLLLMLVVIIAASSVLVTQLSDSRLRARQNGDTHAALAAAKRALISYAATYADRNPGSPAQLPCPDLNAGGGLPDGESHTNTCGAMGVTMLGRFPWRTVDMAVPRDASGSCIWYAVSGTYKSAGAATAGMINPDSNGQLQLFSVETGVVVDGMQPQDRPVAMLFAPRMPLTGQSRGGVATPGVGCSVDFNGSDYLDSAPAIGVDNASVSGTADTLESFAVSVDVGASHNDGVLTVTRAELAAAVYGRHDFLTDMEGLTRGLASCIAAYGEQNPAGMTDRRLPWPAPVALVDYSVNINYDDADVGVLSGRLPDVVDDSGAMTGSAIARVISDCNAAVASDWDTNYLPLWRNWKDHFFYSVAESYEPGASVPTACGACLTVNGGGAYAAVVLFAGQRLPALAQDRNAPPTDGDTKQLISNYLEGRNAGNHPYAGGTADYESATAGSNFNDIAFCIDSSMSVSAC